ncbi:cytochrome b/b6 domain-containing protein [Novosphingobium sp. BL-8H]|uniref:cytochrome b/b6 domain-containing protein n=1 Tax=Novosphingobium sp. BL-8H TaxID=3127640 RepID=UPI003756829E
MKATVRVWDFPTRLGHWSMVCLFALSWWSAERRMMDWHYSFGVGWVALVSFRLIWGIIGPSTSRFGNFVRGPKTILAYLRGRNHAPIGHNPAGAYSVITMLLALVVQIGSGLFSTDTDGLESGPLSFLISFDAARLAARIHAWSFNVLIGLIMLHIAAIVAYRVLGGRNLVAPMISGRTHPSPGRGDEMLPAGLPKLALATLIAGTLAWEIGRGFGL